jgi:hypothetical protein
MIFLSCGASTSPKFYHWLSPVPTICSSALLVAVLGNEAIDPDQEAGERTLPFNLHRRHLAFTAKLFTPLRISYISAHLAFIFHGSTSSKTSIV